MVFPCFVQDSIYRNLPYMKMCIEGVVWQSLLQYHFYHILLLCQLCITFIDLASVLLSLLHSKRYWGKYACYMEEFSLLGHARLAHGPFCDDLASVDRLHEQSTHEGKISNRLEASASDICKLRIHMMLARPFA